MSAIADAIIYRKPETPWVTNPYVWWRHPVARILSVLLLLLLDICVFGADPINESHADSSILVTGHIYNFLFRLPASGGRILSRLGLIFLSCAAGLYIGRQWIHHRLLRDVCDLSMFAGTSGTFCVMGLVVCCTCLAGGAIYNLIIPRGGVRVSGTTGMEARTFGKLLHILSAIAHIVAAVQVVDSVMQDRQRYPDWARELKLNFRQSSGGWLRILCAWITAGSLLGLFLWSCLSAPATWGHLNEIERVFFASSLTFLNLFIVVQDWEFPTFQPPPHLDKPLLIGGFFTSSLQCGLGARLLQSIQGKAGASPSSLRRAGSSLISQGLVDKMFDVTISGPWLAYGPLFLAECLDFLWLLSLLLYSPKDYGQYVDPGSHRIWTIVDGDYLSAAFDSSGLQHPDLVSWASRRNESGLPLTASAASDVLSTASWSGAALVWKILAAAPGILMLFAFFPLAVVGDRLGRRADGRPPLIKVDPDPEVVRPVRRKKLRNQDISKPKSPQLPLTPPREEPQDDCQDAMQTPKMFDGLEHCTFEPAAPPPPLLEEPPYQPVINGSLDVPAKGVAVDFANGHSHCNGHDEAALCKLDFGQSSPVRIDNAIKHFSAESPKIVRFAEDICIDSVPPSVEPKVNNGASFSPTNSNSPSDVTRMTSNELHLKARVRQAKKELRSGEHFDVLLRKEGKPLGLSFKLPCNEQPCRSLAEAPFEGPELRLPDGLEPISFGRYKGMPMCDVADCFPNFCRAVLAGQQSDEYGPDELRFTMYLRMARPEFAEDEDAAIRKDATTLLLVDVRQNSAVDDYNRAQAAVGAWDRVVLPGMHISSVNGIRHDPLAMANSLCKCEVLTVRFHYLRNTTELPMLEPLHLNGKAQRLLEERVSKLMRMEGEEIANSMRTQADWETMAASLASALVKEVYKGNRLMHSSHAAMMHPGIMPHAVPLPAPPQWGSPDRMMPPSLPAGLPPELPTSEESMNASPDRLNGTTSFLDHLSDSEESV